VTPRSRAVLVVVAIGWLALVAPVEARRADHKAMIFKKGSPSVGEMIPQRQLREYLTRYPVPDYLENPMLRKLTGVGIFDLRIDPATGETTGIRIVKSTGHSELDVSAMKALIRWRFKPGTLVRAIFPYMFAHYRSDWPITPQYYFPPNY
jgi:TonB family protein